MQPLGLPTCRKRVPPPASCRSRDGAGILASLRAASRMHPPFGSSSRLMPLAPHTPAPGPAHLVAIPCKPPSTRQGLGAVDYHARVADARPSSSPASVPVCSSSSLYRQLPPPPASVAATARAYICPSRGCSAEDQSPRPHLPGVSLILPFDAHLPLNLVLALVSVCVLSPSAHLPLVGLGLGPYHISSLLSAIRSLIHSFIQRASSEGLLCGRLCSRCRLNFKNSNPAAMLFPSPLPLQLQSERSGRVRQLDISHPLGCPWRIATSNAQN